MTNVDYEKLEGLIFKAVQQGKQETSGLVDMVIHKMEAKLEESIAKSITYNVNGKIKAIDEKIDNYIEKDLEWKKLDEEWKEEIIPQIEAVKEFRGWGKVSVGLISFFAAIGGFVLLVINLWKNLK